MIVRRSAVQIRRMNPERHVILLAFPMPIRGDCSVPRFEVEDDFIQSPSSSNRLRGFRRIGESHHDSVLGKGQRGSFGRNTAGYGFLPRQVDPPCVRDLRPRYGERARSTRRLPRR